jgi:hypothetical protein
MLFICERCGHGHDATNIEQFIDSSTFTRRRTYLCKQHINHAKNTTLVHIPWVADTINNITEFAVTRESLIMRENLYLAAAAGAKRTCKACKCEFKITIAAITARECAACRPSLRHIPGIGKDASDLITKHIVASPFHDPVSSTSPSEMENGDVGVLTQRNLHQSPGGN